MRYVYIFIYVFIYLFIGFSGCTVVQSVIVYGVNLFTMPGMQRVVYTKSSIKSLLQPVVVYCLLP